ncbi:MAG: hypothetical protein IPP49_19580 [Saprospiraceae bacterium]|nr:hypothetical protein [Saprospiraceae bacterium]
MAKKDSVIVDVKADPNSPVSNTALAEIRKAEDQHTLLVKDAKTAFEKLTNARKSISIVEKILETQPDTIKKTFQGYT